MVGATARSSEGRPCRRLAASRCPTCRSRTISPASLVATGPKPGGWVLHRTCTQTYPQLWILVTRWNNERIRQQLGWGYGLAHRQTAHVGRRRLAAGSAPRFAFPSARENSYPSRQRPRRTACEEELSNRPRKQTSRSKTQVVWNPLTSLRFRDTEPEGQKLDFHGSCEQTAGVEPGSLRVSEVKRNGRGKPATQAGLRNVTPGNWGHKRASAIRRLVYREL